MSCQTSYTYQSEVLTMNEKIGVVKEIDNLGRLVIPKEMRETFKLDKSVELVVTRDGVLIRNPKYRLIEKDDIENNSTTL